MDTGSINLPEGYKLDASPEGINLPAGYKLDDQDGPSALGAAGRGALDAIPFGTKGAAQAEYIATGKPYEENLAGLDQKLAADKEQQPVAHYAGEAVGTVAPFAIPGVGEMLGGESLAGRAAIGAGIGGLQGASSNRNPDSMLGDVAKGAAVGAIAQPIIGGIGDALGGAADSLVNSKLGGRANATLTAQTNGFNPLAMRKLALQAGENPEDAVNQLAAKLQKIVPENYYSPSSSVNEKIGHLQDIHDEAGEIMGISRRAASGEPLAETQDIINELGQKAANWRDLANPEGAETVKQAATTLQALNNKHPLTFSDVMSFKKSVGKNFESADIKPGAAEIYGTLSDHLDKALERMAPDSPDIDPAAFQAAKQRYALTSKVLPLMMRGAGREVNSALSPMKAMTGLGSIALGHPMGAVATGAKAIQELGAPQLPANLGMMAMNGLRNGANMSTAKAGPLAANTASNVLNGLLDHPAMRPFVPHYQNALQGVTDRAEQEKAAAVTDYTLSQSNPAYAKAKAQAQGEK